MKAMFGSRDGIGYVKWMKSKGFTMSEEIHDALDVGVFVHQDVPDFMVSNKPKYTPAVEIAESAAFTLFDQDLADKVTEEGQSILASMVSEVVQRSHNTITANPEAGRTWEVIF